MISAAALLLICVVAFLRPIWGLAILLVLTSTLFNLRQYVTVPLPIGYIEPTESLLFSMLLRILWDRRQNRPQKLLEEGSSVRESFAARVLISATLPYVMWQTACCIRGIVIWQGTEHFRFAVRYLISGLFPWSLIAIVWTMRNRTREIWQIVFALVFITALLHTAIQVLDYRPIMTSAYWVSTTEFDFLADGREYHLWTDDFVRGLPQGLFLMIYVVVYIFAHLFCRERYDWSSAFEVLFVVMQILALVVTFTRTSTFQAITGCLVVVCLAAAFRLMPMRALVSRLTVGVFILILILVGYGMVRPGFADLWNERIEQLFGSADYKILSEENEARGRDNVASCNAIRDHPILGCGTPRYPDEYSLRDVPPTDIHPLLQIGLVGGIPAIVLVLRLQWVIFWRFWRASVNNRACQRRLLGYFSVIALTGVFINLCGAGGTLLGNSLLSMTLFIGLMAAEFADPVAARSTDLTTARKAARSARSIGLRFRTRSSLSWRSGI